MVKTGAKIRNLKPETCILKRTAPAATESRLGEQLPGHDGRVAQRRAVARAFLIELSRSKPPHRLNDTFSGNAKA